MAYLRGERQQTQLFPASLEEYVGVEDPVRVYDAFVDQLDFKELGIVLDDTQIGPPEFDPHAMVKLIILWLVGGLKPDHKTIARFRRDHREALKGILKQCVRLCMELGLIEGNTLFVDGTKIRANAGMRESGSPERCERVLQKTDAHIERILKECETVDAAESDDASLANHPGLKDAVALKAKVEAIAQVLKHSGKTRVNTTDPDCRHMQGRQGSHASYNVQIVVDDKNGLIVHKRCGQ